MRKPERTIRQGGKSESCFQFAGCWFCQAVLEADRKAKSFANLVQRSHPQEKLLFMFVLGKAFRVEDGAAKH